MFTPFWRMEEQFWLLGPDYYAGHLAQNARMIFPDPVGIIENGNIIEMLRQAPRWRSVEISERSQARLEETIILAYHAVGVRDSGATYKAYCSSIYVKTEGDWQLLAHQQTPID
ncbi:DUF4440 domain-containing protein [uncultured Cohaesibacter sp.]|uniref:DUF4440 domain-containing protein n=1 Tax=uncultured Cohaesibacter sp. TaxID=1002546 RepID=UPI0029C78A2F|nr:DUF4440 domain-containing protein [uncultured Cohaesibacter sp.]